MRCKNEAYCLLKDYPLQFEKAVK